MDSFPETYIDPLWRILFGCKKCGYKVNGREYSKRVYGHLPTTERNRLQEVYSPPHNNSAIIDTVYLPRIFAYLSSPNSYTNIICRSIVELVFPSVWRRLPRPSRSMHFGDVSETNNSLGPRDPKRIGHAQ